MSVLTYKCPHCGGDLNFDPESQKTKCDFCLSTFTDAELEASTSKKVHEGTASEMIEDASDHTDWNKEEGKTLLYTCPSCGAETVTDETTSATICCYCHNPIVLTKQLEGEFRPSKVIPFKLSSNKAVESFLAWRKKKWFLPDDFSSPSQLEKIAGLYVPYWLVDCEVTGAMSARGRNIRSWRSGEYQYTQTDEYALYREATMRFDYLPHDASSKADDKVMESIGPFNYDELEDFSHSYLSGFMAEKYDVTKEDVYPIIKSRVDQATKDNLRSSMQSYSMVNVLGSQVHFNKTRFHYTLMPVWILTYIYKGETYLFAMNGQTGKLYGNLPLSNKRLAICFGIVFIITFIICLIGGFYIWQS